MKKTSILAAVIGNILEWYDFTLYAFLAPIIAHNFFSEQNHLNAMLSTFLIFAMGFFIRPVGAILLGHLGDRLGRKTILKVTVLLISLPTIGISLLPNYQQWGIYASLSLAFLRLLQGLCIGGEFSGSMIYLTEMAPDNQRALMSCMANNGSNLGVLCATLIAAFISSLMSESTFYAYGWRIPFFLGGIIGLLGLWWRRDIDETPIFNTLREQGKLQNIPLVAVLKNHRLAVSKIFLLSIMAATGSYILMNFMSTYLHQYFHYSLSQALQIAAIYNALTFLLVTIAARCSDQYGRRVMLMIAAIGYIVFSAPCFYLLKTTHSCIWLLPLVIFYCIEEATTPATMIEIFPASARYTGIALGYNLAMALFGGTAPFINTWLISKYNNPLIIAYYLTTSAVISLIVISKKLPKEFGQTRKLLDLDYLSQRIPLR